MHPRLFLVRETAYLSSQKRTISNPCSRVRLTYRGGPDRVRILPRLLRFFGTVRLRKNDARGAPRSAPLRGQLAYSIVTETEKCITVIIPPIKLFLVPPRRDARLGKTSAYARSARAIATIW